jgi:hypothetical protein
MARETKPDAVLALLGGRQKQRNQLDERPGACLPRKPFIDPLSSGTLPKGHRQIVELQAQTMRRELEGLGFKSTPPQAVNAA